MSQISFLSLTWSQFHQDVFELAKKVEASGQKFDRIVCIDRGGAIVARFLSDFLGLKISSFVMVAYKEIGKLSQPKILEELKTSIKDEKILLVDEIIDSGSSFEAALEYLRKFQPQEIVTLAPYIKPISRFKPDFWQVETDQWVIFPYEVRETISDVSRILKKQGKIDEEIEKQISEFGFNDEQVSYFSKDE
ncbi:MAG: phosphoribosyltransferase [Candidatus Pacebacteria bacterium]|jgi:uncharacterized protein|nr:phosphoribosyltransferase [Candidatus Paceibacterota bacterium]MBT3511960.1 phosphoribosyltransferase [Candidatus Paceibacterota bacterium]MBT4005282.1 phosphoribosyltransferase [Candidatus Paceibacterota bacterium]MBT4358501.1 phosphoribosyltransferase [Candidatus Paceibacterota bacterium]MBT4681149.1 phosphoribosyltransferase [Candidatus Paceibacterota bacterium]